MLVSKCTGDLESKQAEAAQLKAEQQKLLQRLKLYESKVLQSGENGTNALVEKAREREVQLQKKQEELERRYSLVLTSLKPAPRCLRRLYHAKVQVINWLMQAGEGGSLGERAG